MEIIIKRPITINKPSPSAKDKKHMTMICDPKIVDSIDYYARLAGMSRSKFLNLILTEAIKSIRVENVEENNTQ